MLSLDFRRVSKDIKWKARLCLAFKEQLPKNNLKKINFIQKLNCCRMKDDGYKIRDEYGVYYITFAVVEWVDVFSRKLYTDIVLDSFSFAAMSPR